MASKLPSVSHPASHKPQESHNTTAADTKFGGDKSIMKVSCKTAPKGEMGQKYLAAGVHMGMRLWDNEPLAAQTIVTHRDYETLGFVIKGKAELLLEGMKGVAKAVVGNMKDRDSVSNMLISLFCQGSQRCVCIATPFGLLSKPTVDC